MKDSISIYKNGYAYFGTDPIEKGFVGKCSAKSNDIAIIIFKPETTTEDQIESLNIIIQELQLKQKSETPKIKEAA